LPSYSQLGLLSRPWTWCTRPSSRPLHTGGGHTRTAIQTTPTSRPHQTHTQTHTQAPPSPTEPHRPMPCPFTPPTERHPPVWAEVQPTTVVVIVRVQVVPDGNPVVQHPAHGRDVINGDGLADDVTARPQHRHLHKTNKRFSKKCARWPWCRSHTSPQEPRNPRSLARPQPLPCPLKHTQGPGHPFPSTRTVAISTRPLE
jgi:hypothetical protein